MSNKLQALLAYYLIRLPEEQLSNSTKKTYASLARQFIFYMEDRGLADDFTAASLGSIAQDFLSSDTDGKASSVNSRASAVKHFLKLSGIPIATLERPQTRLTTRECLTNEELESFINSARKFRPRDKAIGLLFATTGIRLKECAALNLDNIDYVDGRMMLEVERAGRRQQIPLLSEVQSALEAYLDVKDERAEGDERGYALFTDRSGERLSMRALTASVRKIGWAAKLAVTPAVLRVTRLTSVARDTNDAVSVAYLGGFNSLESAKRIIRASKHDLTRASVQADLDRNKAGVVTGVSIGFVVSNPTIAFQNPGNSLSR